MQTELNAANEKAVQLYLERKICYLEIMKVIRECMQNHKGIKKPTVRERLETEQQVYEFIDKLKR